MRLKITLSILVALFFLKCGYAQRETIKKKTLSSELKFYLLDMDDGLSNNLINDIVQDSLGFIWIATTDGLNRYDGTSFKTYKTNTQSKSSGIANNYIQQLRLSKNGKLLIATDGGLNIYDSKTESFSLIDKTVGLEDNSVSCMTDGPESSIVIGTYGGGIQFAGADEKLILPHISAHVNHKLSSKEISTLSMQGDSILWVGTFNNGLNKIDLNAQKTSRVRFRESGALNSPIINSVYTDREGNLWVGTRKGLSVITVNGDTLQLNQSYYPDLGLSDDDVLCFREDNKGNMWIGTRNGGLNILEKNTLFDQQKGRYNNEWYLPDDNGSSVYNRTVSSISIDSEGDMWLATPTGLNYVNPSGERIKLLQKQAGTSETLSHNRIAALANNKGGKIWIGTDGGGLDLYDPAKHTFEHFKNQDKDPHSLSNNYILSILEDSRSRLWVGTYQGGLNKKNTNGKSFKHYLQGSINEGSDIRVLFEDKNKQVWVGTNRGGLYKYLENENRFKFIKTLGKIDIRDIVEDKTGNLWLATYGNGLVQLNPKTEKTIYYTVENTPNFPSNMLFCLNILPDGDMLAGTRYGGLLRFSPYNKSFLTFTEKDGLSNNTINSMVIDDNGQVWLGTFNGISRYNPLTNELLNLKSLNNLQHGEFNIGAALTSTSGLLYFGGNKGLNIFNPLAVLEDKKYFIVLNDLKVLNEPVSITPDKKNGVLQKSIEFQDNIILDYDQNSFSLNFLALKFPDAKNIVYSYLLEGYTKYWIETKGAGTVNISNLPPGEYTLKMKAESSLGKAAYKNLHITISPPFWKTIPAYVLYLMLMAGLIWALIKYYSERIHLKNSLLFEKKQRQLEHDLNEERLRFFTGFSHELMTPLTLILAPLENLFSQIKSKKQLKNLQFIERNAHSLHRSISKLLEFRKSEEGLSQLNIEGYILSGYLSLWVKNYQPLAKEKKITLQCTVPEEKMLFWVDLDKMQVIVNNLLSNAIKYGEEGGNVLVALTHDNMHFEIKVKDSGTGIKQDELAHIFDWYYRSGSQFKKKGTGIGLALTKRFVELHHGTIAVASTLGVETCFTVSIPKEKNNNDFIDKESKINQNWEQIIAPEESGQIQTTLPRSKEVLINSGKERELILLIDDNPEILLFLDDILQGNYDLIHAQDGLEGIHKATKYIPNLIITDVMMPEKSGIDLCRDLKNNAPTSHVPIVLLTAKGNNESINTGFEQGADDYIIKPFSSKLLKTRIKNLLDNRKQLQSYFQKVQSGSENPYDGKSFSLDKEKAFLSQLEALILVESQSGNNNLSEEISKKMGMSRTSLYRKIKALTGQNINAYMREVRIIRAAQLIEKENLTVSQASFEVGFNSVKYFRKIFKEHYGKLPSDFK